MKRIILKTIALLLAHVLPLALLAVNTITYTATYDMGNVTLGTDTLGGFIYTTVNYDGLWNGGDPGAPSLPIDYIRFSVPYNATNFTVNATLSNNALESIPHLVYPCQQPRMMEDTVPWSITLPDNSIYNSGSYYPVNNAWVVDEGFLAGENHIVTVAVMPISFRARKNGFLVIRQLKESRTVNLTLSYELSDSLAMYPIIRQDTALRSEGYRVTQSRVVNPNDVVAHAPTNMIPDTLIIVANGASNSGGLRIDIPGLCYDTIHINKDVAQMAPHHYPYLIITSPEFKHSVRRIVALKEQKGYNVKVVTMDEVMNHYAARLGDLIKQPDGTYVVACSENEGVLRQYLKYCHAFYGTDYVLLVGNGVPHKTIPMYLQEYNKSFQVQSDLYFCDLNADWSNDTIDSEAEVFVGRILAQESEQINDYTDKLLRYDINPGHGNSQYLNRAFYSQGYDMRIFGEVDSVRNVLDSIFPNPFVMEESKNYYDKSKFPSGRDIINEINNTQYGFLSLHHHGYPSGLLTYGFRNGRHADKYRFLWSIDSVHTAQTGYVNDDTLTLNGLNNLTNKWYPSICYSIACHTIPFIKDSFYSEIPMVFGESFTTGTDYGGPIFIGNTNSGLTPTSAYLECEVARELLNGNYKIGVANSFGKSNFYQVNHSKYIRSKIPEYVIAVQNLIGDPSLEMWTDIPLEFTGIEVNRTNNSISVSGIPQDTVTIVYRTNDGIHKRISRNSTSITFSQVSPNGTIMLTNHNYLPYIAPMALQNVTLNKSQYVIAGEVVAGYSVDPNRTYGNVIISRGIEYEI